VMGIVGLRRRPGALVITGGDATCSIRLLVSLSRS
jgi:hypothetical protein